MNPDSKQSDDLAALLLLVDDNPINLKILCEALDVEGYQLLTADTGEAALSIAKATRPDLILLDIMLPGSDGYEVCRQLRDDPATRDIAVIFLSALEDTGNKIKGFSLGAIDYVTKPFNPEEVAARVRTHLTIQALRRELRARNEELEHELHVAQELLNDAYGRVEGALLGESRAVRALREAILAAAASDEALLLVGPAGAGSEAVARAVHRASQRRSRPFIYVNCRPQPGRGSTLFTRDSKDSRFDLAAGGTLFLDEVWGLPTEEQYLLAQILQNMDTDPAASGETRPDVRVIAYTSHGLSDSFGSPALIGDLIRLFSQRQIPIPTLAERFEDIPLLADHFVELYAQRFGKNIERISESSIARLQKYYWPGNVRELETVLERIVIASNCTVLEVGEDVLEPGISLGSYRLVSKLGQGGMGEVWFAKHQHLARPAAVKLIRSDRAQSQEETETAVNRFQREAQITANLRSPFTVELYDFGLSEDGSFYYVMELLDGLDLGSLVRKFGALRPQRVVWLLCQACRSLQEAHEAGLVHRDIKPANLFVCRLGPEYDFLKVLDFGIVKGDVHGTQATATTLGKPIIGTPACMPPEQITEGKSDARSDIYSLGCVAYFLLTGRFLFEPAAPMQMLAHHISTPPQPPSRVCPRVIPQKLDRLVLWCLEKQPEARPSCVQELYSLLSQEMFEHPWSSERAREWWEVFMPDSQREELVVEYSK